MKPLTRFGTLRRLEALEGEARARSVPRKDEAASQSKCAQVVAIVLDGSLSNEAAAAQISAIGGRGEVRSVARVRELLDLARMRKAQGIQFA